MYVVLKEGMNSYDSLIARCCTAWIPFQLALSACNQGPLVKQAKAIPYRPRLGIGFVKN